MSTPRTQSQILLRTSFRLLSSVKNSDLLTALCQLASALVTLLCTSSPAKARPKINVPEALQVMSAIRRPYTGPALRLVRHDEDGTSVAVTQPEEKADLFS